MPAHAALHRDRVVHRHVPRARVRVKIERSVRRQPHFHPARTGVRFERSRRRLLQPLQPLQPNQPNQPNRFTLLKLHLPIVIAGKTESIFDMRDVPAGYCISLHLERQIVQVSRLSNDGKKRHTVVVPLSDVAQLSYETDLRTDAERAAQP